jgi:hypothetical protein
MLHRSLSHAHCTLCVGARVGSALLPRHGSQVWLAAPLICLSVLPCLYCSCVLKWDRHYDPDMDDRHKIVQLAQLQELKEGP